MANLIVKFTSTTPDQTADMATMTPAIGPNSGPWVTPGITTPSGTTPIQGNLTAGTNPFFPISGVGGPYITWYNNRTGVRMMQWQMASAANAVTGYDAILAKLNAVLAGGTAVQAVSLTSAGVVADL